jgi:hypothetical protein
LKRSIRQQEDMHNLCHPVSTQINQMANGDVECSAAVELAQIQNRLFPCRQKLVVVFRVKSTGQS